MATCGSLQHIFEKPLPENPTLLESLSSWKQIKPRKPIEDSSFTEIFGELHFKENHPQEPSSPSLNTITALPPSSSPLSFSSLIQVAPQLARVSNDNEETVPGICTDPAPVFPVTALNFAPILREIEPGIGLRQKLLKNPAGDSSGVSRDSAELFQHRGAPGYNSVGFEVEERFFWD